MQCAVWSLVCVTGCCVSVGSIVCLVVVSSGFVVFKFLFCLCVFELCHVCGVRSAECIFR